MTFVPYESLRTFEPASKETDSRKINNLISTPEIHSDQNDLSIKKALAKNIT